MQRSCASRSRSPRRPALSCGPGDGLGFAAVDVLRLACADAAANPPSVMHEHVHSSLRNARQPPPALSRSRFCQPAAPLTGYDGRLAEVCVASGGAATWACEARACSDLVLLRAELEQARLPPPLQVWTCLLGDWRLLTSMLLCWFLRLAVKL